ncbi:MAG: 4-(cytidine 5'-diphospho)-2-C-methyl-D-erythritol kinase [Candidatus Fermentibacteraceae bacterium]|nr:4-(cytidine 5'-diphospho)-2-C-methyl-D-erythritol kinase [Candidatus Fermentibacteraceae bacterium]
MRKLLVEAPAKLNLGLEITGLRSDGFHELKSIFSTVSLSDSLTVSVNQGVSGVKLQCSGIPSPGNKNNLVWMAAEAFLEAAGISDTTAVSISLRKSIPSPGGLGGGSSDAAAVLLALQELTKIRIDLESPGESLGSDVPFFLLQTGAAFVTGRGEILEPVELPDFHCVLVHSGENIPTPLAYKLWDDNAGDLTEAWHISNYTARKFGAWHEGKPFPVKLDNQFLPLLRSRYRGVDHAAEELSRLTVNWGLSGSGPVLYTLFRSGEEAKDAEEYLAGKFPWVLRCQSR